MTDAHPSEAWFQLVFEAAPNAMLMVDGDRAIRLVNRGAEALFGYDRRELIGRPVEVLLPPRFAGRHAAHAQAFLERPSARAMGAGRDLYGLRKDGTEVPIEIGLSPVETSAGRITIASIVDISERAMLRERFRDLAESLPHMVWTCAGDGPCDYLSPQWVAYTGIPEEQQLGYRWLEQLHPDDIEPTKERWARAAARGGTFDTEFRIRRHDGAYRWFKTRAVPIRDAAGRITKWFGSNTDIQDLRDAQEATARLNRELEARVLARTEALREANARLETVAMQLLTAQRITQVGSWELDVATGAVTWSVELFRIFGLSPTDSGTSRRCSSPSPGPASRPP
jgi:PAS domain S-box-containing protein